MGQCCSDTVDTPTKSKRYLDAKDNTTAGVVTKGGNANGVTKNGKKKPNGNDDEDEMGDNDDGRTHSAPTSPVTGGHKQQRVAPHSNPDPPRAKTRAQGIAGTTPAGGKAKHGHGRGAAPTEKRRRVMQRNLSHVSLSSPRKAENSTSSRSGTGDKNSFLRPSASNTLGSANFKPSSRAPQFTEAEIVALRGLAVERGDKEATMLRLAFQSNGSASNDGGSPPNGMLSPAGGGTGNSIIAVSMSLQDFQSWLLDSDEHPRDHYDAPSPLSSPLAAGLHGLTSVGGSVMPALTLSEALMQCFYIQQLFIDAQVNVGNGDVPHSRFGFSDFLKLISLALATSEQLLLFAFRALDTDEDGVIDNDDISFLARALASIRIPPEWGIAETSHAPSYHHTNTHYSTKESNTNRMSSTNRTAAASTMTTTTTAAVAEVTETDVGDRGSPPTLTMDYKTPNSATAGSPTTSPRPYYIHLPPEAKASQPVSDLMGPLINVVVEYALNRREREQRYSVYPGSNNAATIPTELNSEMGTSVSSGSGNSGRGENGKIAISLSDFSQLCKQFDWILAPVRRLQQVIRHKTLSEEAWVRLMAVRDRSKLDSPSSLHPVNPTSVPPPLTMGASAVTAPTSQSASSSTSSSSGTTHQQIHITDNGMATVTVTGLTISTGASSKDWPAPLMAPYVTPPGTSAPRILPGLAAVSMPAAEMVSHMSHNSISHIMTSASAPNSSTDVVADHATAAILPGTLNGSSHDNH